VITLVIDASTYVGTVAVLRDGRLASHGSAAMRGRDAEALMPAVADCLTRAGVQARELSRVVCGSGPGSFTSVRIAAAIAKGVASGAGCPLFGLSSLALLAVGDQEPRPGNYLAVLDALRGEAYVGGYSVAGSGQVAMILGERLVRHTEVDQLAAAIDATTVGPAQRIERAPDARAARLLEAMIAESGPVNLAEWEPRYGRKAEAQMRWEAAHQKPLPVSGSAPQ
jgi:tRNA threonylcarbamoyladenosine biosynthesis protein TsaB